VTGDQELIDLREHAGIAIVMPRAALSIIRG
jgi:hypothetical protein